MKYQFGEFNENFYNRDIKEIQQDDVSMSMFLVNCIYQFDIHERIKPYVLGGMGHISLDSDYINHKSSMRFIYGSGIKFYLTKQISLRSEFMHIFSTHESRNNLAFHAGISFHSHFSDKKAAFQKQSQIPLPESPIVQKQDDEKKIVADSPMLKDEPEIRKEKVNKPVDSDQDGIFDNEDRCPDTEQFILVDLSGCPLDSDRDGIFDTHDQCPNTLKYVEVDQTGCPIDNDNDKVYDYADKCPNSLLNEIVDRSGCPKDSDNDGVKDSLDKCSNTDSSGIVDTEGCVFSKVDTGIQPNENGYYPYVIQISSYKNLETANKIALEFQAKGDPTFTSVAYIARPIETWYRIFFGVYGRTKDIESSLIELEKRSFRHYIVIKLPYAIQLGTYHTEREIQEMQSYLLKKGYIAYRIQDIENKSIRLLTGAFESKKKATKFLQYLKRDDRFCFARIVLR